MVEFSVLLSVYYKEKSVNLKLALESVFDQSQKPNEVVLVIDGPIEDNLWDIIKMFSTKYSEKIFKIVPLEKNLGLGEALRIGVLECTKPIIARMDTDDICRRDRFKKQLEFLVENSDIDVVGSNIEEFNQIPGDLRRFKKNPEFHDQLISNIKLKSPFNHPSIMMRKESLIFAGNYNGDLMLFEDYSLFLRMWKAGLKFHNLQEVLLDFRVGSGLETIKRRSGVHYLRKELNFIRYCNKNNIFTSLDFYKYILLKFPIRLLPSRLVLWLYNKFLRSKK